MTSDISATGDIDPPLRPTRLGFMAVAILPWKLIVRAMTRRTTSRTLHALDDHLLKDIGISRGGIERIARDAADTAKQRTFIPEPLTRPNPTKGETT